MSSEPPQQRSGTAGAAQGAAQPSEEELRAAYEAELSRITCAEVMLQTAVSLLNLGARRLGRGGGAAASGAQQPSAAERDLEQVRDAIDGVRALLDVLERSVPRELAPLREALSQLQIAYAQEAQAGAAPGAGTPAAGRTAGAPAADQGDRSPSREQPGAEGTEERPGPAQASGRLWVPGR